MNSQTAYFRVDASQEIGIGHVMRCLTLADELRDQAWHCSFISSPETPTVASALYQSEYEVYPPDFCPAETDLLVVDHYGLDKEYEQSARKWAKSILVIDDLANRQHDCDILVDQTFGRDEQDYASLTPKGAKVLCGSEYALLRSMVQSKRISSLNRRDGNCRHILVSFGGTNIGKNLEKTLDALLKIKLSLDIGIILGNAVSNIILQEKLDQICNSIHKVMVFNFIHDIGGLMHDADLAIGTVGTTSWERCCLGLPTLTIEVAENQSKIAENLAMIGAIQNLGWYENVSAANISKEVKTMIENPGKLKEMSVRASEVCDGQGINRILDQVFKLDV